MTVDNSSAEKRERERKKKKRRERREDQTKSKDTRKAARSHSQSLVARPVWPEARQNTTGAALNQKSNENDTRDT